MNGSIFNVVYGNVIAICKKISGLSLSQKYYLAGGTGLALQLKHRVSNDLDFFSISIEEAINAEEIIAELEKVFYRQPVKVILKTINQLDLSVKGIKVSFLSYPFPLINPLINGEEIDPELAGIKIASPAEIALMKAYSLGRRSSFRDYIDIYFLLKLNQVDLDYIRKNAAKKYILCNESVFSMKQFLEQLNYTADVFDKEEAVGKILDKSVNVAEIESYLSGEAVNYTKKRLSLDETVRHNNNTNRGAKL